MSETDNNPNIVRVGDFMIDIDIISKDSLIKMRRLLPKTDYKLIKNRKCARLTRLIRKHKTENTQLECQNLRRMNANLQAQVDSLK